ncbi:hypothetical protein JB92DRAFT_2925997 [Gautieria morchelliformis]|nr:hypothetical protein JB92DRAFT_2925997 [Gautieria morchelliformis]
MSQSSDRHSCSASANLSMVVHLRLFNLALCSSAPLVTTSCAMTDYNTDYQIYSRNLVLEGKGFAPWFPGSVNIAEVGYVHRGGWIRLFDASKARGDLSNNLGVPGDLDYVPMIIGEIEKRMLNDGARPFARGRGGPLEYVTEISSNIPVTPGSLRYSFKSSKHEGAILVHSGGIDTQDALEKSAFQKYMRKNYASWLTFANDKNNRDIRLIDLVLVTGCDKTSYWACSAFDASAKVDRELVLDVGFGKAKTWATWVDRQFHAAWGHSGPATTRRDDSLPTPPQSDTDNSDYARKDELHVPRGYSIATGSETLGDEMRRWASKEVNRRDTLDGKNLDRPRDQCIFIRGYKICDKPTGFALLSHWRYHTQDEQGFNVIHPGEQVERGGSGGGDNPGPGGNSPGPGGNNSGPGGNNSSPGGNNSSPGGNNSGPGGNNPDPGRSNPGPRSNRSDLGGNGDQEREVDTSGSYQDHPSGPPGNSSLVSSEGKNVAHFGTGGMSDQMTNPSDSPNLHSQLGYDIDKDLLDYLCNHDKVPTAVEITLLYILENSDAEFALAHDDDLSVWLKDGPLPEDLFSEICRVQPKIFLVDQVGMLETTYLTSLADQSDMEHVAHQTSHIIRAWPPDVELALMNWNEGQGNKAEKSHLQGLDISKRLLGKEDIATQNSIDNLGLTHRYQGRLKEAEGREVEALESSNIVIEEEHPATLISMGNLALTYRNQGRWKDAEDLEVEVLESRKKVLGEEHPDTPNSMGNLALTYRNQGRWKEAEELEVEVLESRKKVLGEEHPATLNSMGNLALTYRNQGRWKEAEELEVEVLESRKKVLGEEHPATLNSMGNLASTYRNQGRWKDAEKLEVQVLELRKRVLGKEHPGTLNSMGNLAATYCSQGRWKEAEKLEVEVLELSKEVLGEEHPATLISMGNLASTYSNQGRWKDAEDLEVQVLELRKRVLGEEHPATLISMGNLASTYSNQGRWKDAEDLEVETLESRKKVLGKEHPDTLISMGNLASTYRNQGRWKDAEELEVEVLEASKKVLGEEHPATLIGMGNLASTYRNQGRWKEAEELEVEVLESSKEVLGKEHPDTLISMGNLASTYRNQGRWKEAEELELEILELSKRVLGKEHPNTRNIMGNLASTYRNQGRWKEAEELEVKVLDSSKKVLGKEHPDTLNSMGNLASTYKNLGRLKKAMQIEAEVLELRKRVARSILPH